MADITDTDRIAALEAQIADLTKALAARYTLPMAVSPKKRLEVHRAGDQASFRRTRNLTDPNATTSGFQPDDVVRLKPDSERAMRMHANLVKSETLRADEALPLGVVLSYVLTHKKTGLRKYKVEFPGIGQDGIDENEMEPA